MIIPSILLAVSGGIDSMVMLHYMLGKKGAGDLAVAHCNFQLRGEESEEDERFVKMICEKYGVDFYAERFETGLHAEENGIGIQEAARELRYDWFFKLKEELDFEVIATAHHLDDSIETYFINLLRGSGPKGLSGIQEDTDRGLIRPLSTWTRSDVESYAERHQLSWREDRSNASDKYLRNNIRHKLLPLLEELRPGFNSVMNRNMKIQKELHALLKTETEKYKQNFFSEEGDSIRIVPSSGPHDSLLFKTALKEYGFSGTQLENITSATQGGKQVFSKSHVLTSHDDGYVLTVLKDFPDGPWVIDESLKTDHLPIQLEVVVLKESPSHFDPDPDLAYIDYDKLKFPLTLRKWEAGDRISPLGMKGKKKVSDLLIDQKISLEEKKQVLVLESEGEIVWILGQRMSEKYKVGEDVTKVILLEVNPK